MTPIVPSQEICIDQDLHLYCMVCSYSGDAVKLRYYIKDDYGSNPMLFATDNGPSGHTVASIEIYPSYVINVHVDSLPKAFAINRGHLYKHLKNTPTTATSTKVLRVLLSPDKNKEWSETYFRITGAGVMDDFYKQIVRTIQKRYDLPCHPMLQISTDAELDISTGDQ